MWISLRSDMDCLNLCQLNILDTKKEVISLKCNTFYLWGLVESPTEYNMSNVGLIKLKTETVLTALNNSPSSREGETSEKALYLFTLGRHVFDCLFQISICIMCFSAPFANNSLRGFYFF